MKITSAGRQAVFTRIDRAGVLAMDAPQTFVPVPHRRSLTEYLNHGRALDSFLMCVLDNNLTGAIREASTASSLHIVSIVRWLWQYAPTDAWGSENARRGWMDARARDALRAAA